MKHTILFITLFLISCSAKTTTKNDNKNDSISKDKVTLVDKSQTDKLTTTKVDSSSTKKSESQSKSILDELDFEPINPKEESSITNEKGQKVTFKNLKGKKRNLSTESKNSSLQVVLVSKNYEQKLKSKNDLLFKRSLEVQKLQRELNNISKREQWSWSKFILDLWWVWLILIVAGYLGYRYYKGLLKFPFL